MTVPELKEDEQVAPQLIPEGDEAMVPKPDLITVRVKVEV